MRVSLPQRARAHNSSTGVRDTFTPLPIPPHSLLSAIMDATSDITRQSPMPAPDYAPKARRTYGKRKEATDTNASASTKSTLLERLTSRRITNDASDSDENMQASQESDDSTKDHFGWKARLAAMDKEFDEVEDKEDPSHLLSNRNRPLFGTSTSSNFSTEGDSFSALDVSLSSGANLHLPSSQTDPSSPARSDSDAKASPKETRALDASGKGIAPSRLLSSPFDDSDDDEDAPRLPSKKASKKLSKLAKKHSHPIESNDERYSKSPSSATTKPKKIKVSA